MTISIVWALRSTTTFPPMGWLYREAATGWAIPNPLSITYEQAIELIILERMERARFGLSTRRVDVVRDFEAQICARLNYDPRYCRCEKQYSDLQSSSGNGRDTSGTGGNTQTLHVSSPASTAPAAPAKKRGCRTCGKG
jgi:hypothetical protein